MNPTSKTEQTTPRQSAEKVPGARAPLRDVKPLGRLGIQSGGTGFLLSAFAPLRLCVNSSSPLRVCAFALILCAFALNSQAANVRFAWTNYLGNPDTNYFFVYPVGDVASSDGSFISKGPATRLTPNSSGLVTNTFEMGTYVASNRFLNRGIAFRVPNDHGNTVYCATCGTNNTPAGTGLAISGFNYFITIEYGTNPPPTFDEVTNALGYWPRPNQFTTNIPGRSVVGPIHFSGAVTNDTLTVSNQFWMRDAVSGDYYQFGLGGGTLTVAANVSFSTGQFAGILSGPVISTSIFHGNGAGLSNVYVLPLEATNGTIIVTNFSNSAGISFSTTSGARWVLNGDASADAFYGIGSFLTDIIGTNIVADTINSNKFDAPTRALLGGGGGSATNAPNIFTNPLAIYLTPNGDDSTAILGREDLPYHTVTNAIANLPIGGTLFVRGGENVTSNYIGFPEYSTIIGDGGYIRSTISNAVGVAPYPTFALSNGVTIRNLTLIATNGFNATIGNVNYGFDDWATLDSCKIYGDSDCYYSIGGIAHIRIQNSLLESKWDALALYGISNTVEIIDSRINVTAGIWTNQTSGANGLRCDQGILIARNCHVSVSGNTNVNRGATVGNGGGAIDGLFSTRVELYNCIFDVSGSNAFDIYNRWNYLDDEDTTTPIMSFNCISENGEALTLGALTSGTGLGRIAVSGVLSSTNYVAVPMGSLFVHLTNSPAIYAGTNVPTAAAPEGSLWLRGQYGGLYFRSNSTWIAVGTGTGTGGDSWWSTNVAAGGIVTTHNPVGIGSNEVGVSAIILRTNGSASFANTLFQIGTDGAVTGPSSAFLLTAAGNGQFTGNVSVDGQFIGDGSVVTGDDEVYGAGWNGDLTLPTKNAVYDKIETLVGGASDGRGWDTNGNASLTSANFVGTLDNVPLNLASSNSIMAVFQGYSNTIVLGKENQITGWQPHSTIAGGRANLINGRTNSAFHFLLGHNFIGGGQTNSINEGSSTLIGRNFIGGGYLNTVTDGGANAISIVGGGRNTNEGAYGFIGGGFANRIVSENTYSNGIGAAIPAGYGNAISGDYSFAAGRSNTITGIHGTIPGGLLNSAPGSNSFAAGFRAKSQHTGSFVWSDSSSESTFTSAADNTFNIRAAGGVYVNGALLTSGFTNTIVSTITYGTTITPDLAIANLTTWTPRRITFRCTLTGNITTVDAPTGTAVDGDVMVWELTQDGTGSRTISGWNSIYTRGDDVTGVTLSTTASRTDIISFVYNQSANKWRLTGCVRGYDQSL